jgi:uncharacterized protein (TIGR04255 family)
MSHIAIFNAPPVVEAVLGIQFHPLPRFSVAHAGIYWRERLGGDFPNIHLQHPLDAKVERFDPEGIWSGSRRVSIEEIAFPDARAQFTDQTEERMVQVQSSWFVFNWRQRGREYPTFSRLLPEFLTKLEGFLGFIESNELGPVKPVQWEVTYVNHIRKGPLWNDVNDWAEVVPGSIKRVDSQDGEVVETINTSWSILLPRGIGRLRGNVRHTRVNIPNRPEPEEVLDFRLSAKGPASSIDPKALTTDMHIGHNAVVNTFLRHTSATAQQQWGRVE